MTLASRALLDTHTFLWFATNDSSLSEAARACISDPAVEKLVSAASVWELAIKVSIGKLELERPFDDLIRGIESNGFVLLPILPAHASRLITLPHIHRDPFDRLLVAQALAEGCVVVSRDEALDAYGTSRLW
jgi:PIN domain nuclease of toxin-antitoxin system